MELRLRRWTSLVVLGIADLVSGLLGGILGFGGSEEPSWKQRTEPNAVLMLVSMRTVRQRPVRLLGERLGSDAISLYLIGAKVRVDDSSDELVLRSRSNSVIASLRSADTGSIRVTVDGPGLDGPTYALFR